MKRVGTALVGCGKIGETHAEILSQLPLSKFIAVFDRETKRTEQFAHQFKVRGYSDFEKFLNDSQIEMVSICTPHPSHPDLTVACAEAGWHVLVEKPMATDLRGCDRMISATDRAGVKLSVVSQRRYYEPVQRIKTAIAMGKIGRPILATLTVLGWRDEAYYKSDPWRGRWDTEGGGVLVNQTSHHLDLLQWFMGPVEELFGYWANLNHPYIEVDDTAVAVLRFRGGALGTILVSNSQKPGLYGRIHVHGENGASVGVQTETGSPFIAGVSEHVEPPFNDLWTVPGEEHLLQVWREKDNQQGQQLDMMRHYHKCQIHDFLDAIIENRAPIVTAAEARKHVELFTAIYQSQRTNKPVSFPIITRDEL